MLILVFQILRARVLARRGLFLILIRSVISVGRAQVGVLVGDGLFFLMTQVVHGNFLPDFFAR